MVAALVRLRWRLILNALSRNIWALIGTLIGGLYGLSALVMLVVGAVALGRTSQAVIAPVIAVVGALTVLCWTLVPLLLTGVDSTLDPRAMAAWVAPSPRLSRGLALAAACGITGVLTGAGTLLPVLAWASAGEVGAALLALVLAPVLLATCVLLSRVVVIGVGVSQSRRGRELAGMVGFLLILAVALLPYALSGRDLGDERALLRLLTTVAQVMGLSPLGWAAAAPGYLAQGRVLPAAALAVASVLLVAVLVPAWDRVARRVMTGPVRSTGRTRAYEASRAGGSPSAPVQPLPWHARLERLMPSPAAAVAARALRYWHRDPRYLSQVVVGVIMPFVFMLGMRLSVEQQGSTLVFGRALGPGDAHPGILVAVVIPALLYGWSLHDDLAYDSTALWQHVSAGVAGRDDLLGRVVAAALWQVPTVVLAGVVGAFLSGRWDLLPTVLGLSTAIMGCAYAWSSVTSVLMPYETNSPGDSLMKSRTSGMILLAALVQVVGVPAIGLMCAPLIAGAVAVVASGQGAWGWALLVGGLAWGVGAAWGGVVLGGRYLDGRGPAVLATIRSWPGHEDVR